MGNIPGFQKEIQLSEFRKRKLLYEFHTFYDVNKDGCLEWKDFEQAREDICKMSGWENGSDKFNKTKTLFRAIWRNLEDCADKNNDGKITTEEWLKMWTAYNSCTQEEGSEDKPPDWLDKYIEYKFHLFDRTGDGEIDIEEFEYVLSNFGVPPHSSRASFIMFSENMAKKIDMAHFKELAWQYYKSDDPSCLGNFINGNLNLMEESKSS